MRRLLSLFAVTTFVLTLTACNSCNTGCNQPNTCNKPNTCNQPNTCNKPNTCNTPCAKPACGSCAR